jgi:hypothetical protein
MNRAIFPLLIVLSLWLLSVSNAYCQSPDTLWSRTYGGSYDDICYDMQQTADGGYVLVGESKSFGGGFFSDIYIMKTDENGDSLWTRVYGGDEDDYGYSIQQTFDGGYIISGNTASFGAVSDIYLLKTDADGDSMWARIYDKADFNYGLAVQQTPDSGFIVVGFVFWWSTMQSDVYMIKTNSQGDTLWTKTFGGADSDWGYAVKQTMDGGYIIAGATESFSAIWQDAYLIKTDGSGNEEWSKLIGGSYNDMGLSVYQTNNNSYLIAGWTSSYGPPGSNAYIINTDSVGGIRWSKVYGGDEDERLYSLDRISSGGYIFAGLTETSSAGSSDVYLIRTDSIGDTIWTGSYGGLGEDIGRAVCETNDGYFAVAGYTSSFGSGGTDFWLLKTEPFVGIEEEKDDKSFENLNLRLQCVPNPFESGLRIDLTLPEANCLKDQRSASLVIYDLCGRKVKDATISIRKKNCVSLCWDGKNSMGNEVPAGIYFVDLLIGDFSVSKKILKLK